MTDGPQPDGEAAAEKAAAEKAAAAKAVAEKAAAEKAVAEKAAAAKAAAEQPRTGSADWVQSLISEHEKTEARKRLLAASSLVLSFLVVICALVFSFALLTGSAPQSRSQT